MIIIPAIDLKDGKVVRLTQGRYDKQKIYSGDPHEVASHFLREGATRIHVVDLEGARTGRPREMDCILDLIRSLPCEFEVGGGVRDAETIRKYLAAGAKRVVCGTRVCADEAFLKEALREFGESLIIAVDSRAGKVLTDGWTKNSGTAVESFLATATEFGAREVLVTDIVKDGMLAGPNLALLRRLADAFPVKLIASGGISSLEDVRALAGIGPYRIFGAVIGKAIYEGKINLREAIAHAD